MLIVEMLCFLDVYDDFCHPRAEVQYFTFDIAPCFPSYRPVLLLSCFSVHPQAAYLPRLGLLEAENISFTGLLSKVCGG